MDSSTDAENAAGDYSYDQAHESVPAAGTAGADPTHPADPITVTTQTADTQGDYSYDLAHDIPRSGD